VDYFPLFEDRLRCRWKTTGIKKFQCQKKNVNFSLYDVGGQRGERAKWKNLKNWQSVVYVASLSEYDQKCYEDDFSNRMLESIKLFGTLVNVYFDQTIPIFLFLTKIDVFERKISMKDLTCVFPEYKGGKDVDAAIDFISMKYKNLMKEPERLKTFVVNVMDEQSVFQAFGNVQNYLL
jgi:guanine nucleotide-binding protein G(i) subunit alpha